MSLTFFRRTTTRRALLRTAPALLAAALLPAAAGAADPIKLGHVAALSGAEKAGSTDGDTIRVALQGLGTYEGLIRTYDQPFSESNHDALGPDDYVMVRYEEDRIVPVQ